jgi:hypothetical protein
MAVGDSGEVRRDVTNPDERECSEVVNADNSHEHGPEMDVEDEPEVDVCVPPPSDDDEEGGPEVDFCVPSPSDDDRPEVDVCVPPPSDDEDDDRPEVDVCLPPPSDDEEDSPEVDVCLPPPSDDEDDGYAETGEEPPAYYPPPDDDVPYPVDVEYPIPSDDAVPYPVDVEYPVGDAYAYPDTDGAYGGYEEMPAVAPYPDADVYTDEQEESAKEPAVAESKTKKKYDGDKVVIGFVPSTVKRKVAPDKAKKDT